ILAGQSNMEGHAQITTFPAIAKDPATAELYKQMVDAQGKPVTCKDVWISYAFGDFGGEPVGRKAGNLSAGWGSQHHVGAGKIGPEFTFGITMQKLLGEPILLIKNAWGGKSLMVDFRPPSAGELADEKNKDKAGKYYGHMMSHVKDVLADPKKVYPGYDSKEGYEIAGFVWFQGFNDLVGSYPSTDPSKGKKAVKDYSEYSRLLACLIRDLRKDLNAPNMPFVTGVLGVGGETSGDGTEAFRKAMAAPGEMEEFKGTVANVYTHKFWPADIDAVKAKAAAATAELDKQANTLKMRAKKGEDVKAEVAKLTADKEALIAQTLTEDEKWLLANGVSNQGFHYWGSGKFFAQAGKAFAEAAHGMIKKP
ncbi:MAG TPA: sialate O-acetylesterase, partial [Luteolibacter sp.]|nr:sialate O-acetylesterase [Luteolibacter sp.]